MAIDLQDFVCAIVNNRVPRRRATIAGEPTCVTGPFVPVCICVPLPGTSWFVHQER